MVCLYEQAVGIDDTFESSDNFAVKMGEAEERSPRSRCDLDQDTRRKTEEHAFSERVGRVEFENDFARKLSKLLGRSAMVSGVFGRWYLSSATIRVPGSMRFAEPMSPISTNSGAFPRRCLGPAR